MFPIPQPGARVKVVTRYPETYYYSKKKYRENVIEGVVMPSFRGDPEGSFLVATHIPQYPVSMITMGEHVVSLEVNGKKVERGAKLPVTHQVFEMKVPQSKGNGFYLVTCIDATWRCDCPAGNFSRKQCRHISIAKEAYDAAQAKH